MITIAWKVSYLQEVDYEVFGDGTPYRISLRWAADDYFRSIYNGDQAQWDHEIVASVGILHSFCSEMVKPEVLAAFRAMPHYHADMPVKTGYFDHTPSVRTWIPMPDDYVYNGKASHESWVKHYHCYFDSEHHWRCEPIMGGASMTPWPRLQPPQLRFDNLSRSWKLDWAKIGEALRESAIDAHGFLPPLDIAWSFLKDNPECFSDREGWPPDFPKEPPNELKMSYYRIADDDGFYCVFDDSGDILYDADTLFEAVKFRESEDYAIAVQEMAADQAEHQEPVTPFDSAYQSLNRYQRFYKHDTAGKLIAAGVLLWIGVRVVRDLYKR